jgi:hypothetical protein
VSACVPYGMLSPRWAQQAMPEKDAELAAERARRQGAERRGIIRSISPLIIAAAVATVGFWTYQLIWPAPQPSSAIILPMTEADRQRLNEVFQAKVADFEAKLRAAAAEQQRLRDDLQRQTKAAEDAEEKLKAAEAEQQRFKEELQRQTKAAADAEYKRKAAAEAEAKRKAEDERQRMAGSRAESGSGPAGGRPIERKGYPDQLEEGRPAEPAPGAGPSGGALSRPGGGGPGGGPQSGASPGGGGSAPAEARPSPQPPQSTTLPRFPWPPPRASASYVLPDGLFDSRSVGEVVAAIISALELNGYVERSFFQTDANGVALVTRLERIRDDGSAFAGLERWPSLTRGENGGIRSPKNKRLVEQ